MRKLLLVLLMACTQNPKPAYTVGDRVELLGLGDICLGTVYAVTKKGTYMVYALCADPDSHLEVYEMHELELQLYTGKEGL